MWIDYQIISSMSLQYLTDPLLLVNISFIVPSLPTKESSMATLCSMRIFFLRPATPQQQRNSFFLCWPSKQVHEERVDVTNLWPNINWCHSFHSNVHWSVRQKPNLSTHFSLSDPVVSYEENEELSIWSLVDRKPGRNEKAKPGDENELSASANAAENVVGPLSVDAVTQKLWRSEKSAMLSSPSENRDVSVIS